METLKIHHIGYLVKKIDTSIKAFKHLGFSVVQDTMYDASREINICFMEKDGYVIELVSPTSAESIVAGLLKKYKNCPYHICYESHNLTSDLNALSAQGYVIIDTPAPAPAIGGRKVVFLIHAALGMIELLEEE